MRQGSPRRGLRTGEAPRCRCVQLLRLAVQGARLPETATLVEAARRRCMLLTEPGIQCGTRDPKGRPGRPTRARNCGSVPSRFLKGTKDAFRNGFQCVLEPLLLPWVRNANLPSVSLHSVLFLHEGTITPVFLTSRSRQQWRCSVFSVGLRSSERKWLPLARKTTILRRNL